MKKNLLWAWLTKFKIPIIIGLIMMAGFFLRFYGLQDWLHFELDQARDAILVRDVLENGWREIPLSGPRAGGSFLRLGPFFYYGLIFSAWLFGGADPINLVLPSIFFGLLNIPLLYFIFKMVFAGQKNADYWALALTFLAGTSSFFVAYDRFAWNPNLMPFFTSLVILLFLKYFESKKTRGRRSFYWAGGLGVAYALISQLHFLPAVALPIILSLTAGLIYLKERRIFGWHLSWKALTKDVLAFFLAFVFIQTPIWINEWISGGSNLGGFIETIQDKQNKDKLHSLTEQLIQNVSIYPKAFFVTITGFSPIDSPVVLLKPKLNVVCDQFCREMLIWTIFSLILFFWLCFWVGKKLVFLFDKTKQDANRIKTVRNFHFEILLLSSIWILVAWWSLYSQSFNLKPRFYLFSAVPMWIVLAFMLQIPIPKIKKSFVLGLILVPIIFGLNMCSLLIRFERAKSAEIVDRQEYRQDGVFPLADGYPVTIKQERMIANWIEQKYRLNRDQNMESLLFFWAPPFYYRPIAYFLEATDLRDEVNYFSNNPTWRQGKYFAVTRTIRPDNFFKKGREENFEVLDYQIFGTLTVYELKLTEKGLETAKKNEKKFLSAKRLGDPAREKAKCLKNPKPECRFNWGDIF